MKPLNKETPTASKTLARIDAEGVSKPEGPKCSLTRAKQSCKGVQP